MAWKCLASDHGRRDTPRPFRPRQLLTSSFHRKVRPNPLYGSALVGRDTVHACAAFPPLLASFQICFVVQNRRIPKLRVGSSTLPRPTSFVPLEGE
jgi:hypothetical protein